MLSSALRWSVNALPWGARAWVRRIPVVAPLQRWLVRRYLSGEEFTHTINAGPARGLRYPVCLPTDKAIWAGTYERGFAATLAAGVTPGDVCYDIGGYRGFMSGVLALAGARLVAVFEPVPENRRQLERVAAANPELPISIHPAAIGARDEVAEFRLMPEASMGKLAHSRFQPEAPGIASTYVPVRTLDTLVFSGALPMPQVIKIDVEGAELDVLIGAADVLRAARPRVYVETHSAELTRECARLLRRTGYEVSVLDTRRGADTRVAQLVCHLVATPAATPA